MDENTIIEQLEELIERFGVQIRHEAIKQDEDSVNVVGGLCLLKGEYVLIINSKATIEDKIRGLGMALKHFDHEKIIYYQFSGNCWKGYLSKDGSTQLIRRN